MESDGCDSCSSVITKYHAKYYANLLTQKAVGGELATISQSLLSSSVDINPHQIDAALFAFKSPLSKGVVLADEVGLGKTIEAGLVVCQYWAMGKRSKAVICSYNFVARHKAEILLNSFDLAVVDEAHKLRNVYRKSSKTAQAVRDVLQVMRSSLSLGIRYNQLSS